MQGVVYEMLDNITMRADDRINPAVVSAPIEWGSDPIRGRDYRGKTPYAA